MVDARLSGLLWRFWPLTGLACALLGAAGFLALAPLQAATSRDQLFEIPRGTWARRMAGNKIEILPAEIRLTLGVRDILVLKNLDDVPQQFGPVLMMPGQSFRLPFEQAANYDFACTAHASGQMRIIVQAHPDSAWSRLQWRVGNLLKAARWS